MTNLFSSFDPSSWLSLSLNWLSSFLILLVIPLSFNPLFSKFTKLIKVVKLNVFKEFSAVSSKISSPGIMLPSLALFWFIALNNFTGLFPFIFTSSAHLTYACALALPLWLGHIIFKNSVEPNATMTHLVPLGTPPILMPFMVLIELTSNIIRPLTLSVRLAANMIAGHLLISLIGHSASPEFNFSIMGVGLALILLCVLESAVSLIQAYVFSMLSTLYFNEVNSSKISLY
uniref:ATP synthase subunit a n=1 Tax=Amphiascoides atopus TaxID=1352461 RepID=W8DN98_9MAXI|nr:ATP synthase F0 subunit 6 [Amphiascoides atopus]AHB52761.1 ATP synthase F0 subunit 6 [Amphiascoides atopus]